MGDQDVKSSADELGIKRSEPRYIMTYEDIFRALTPEEYAVYTALRFETDFSKEESLVKRCTKFLIERSKVKRTKFFECLYNLEHKWFLISRLAGTTGTQNTYNVSHRLFRFQPIEQNIPASAPDAPPLETRPPAERVEDTRPPAERPRPPGGLHIINTSVKDLKKEKKGISSLHFLEHNPFDIPTNQIKDWIELRTTNQKPVTETAWICINDELRAFQEAGEDPREAFKRMVANGWMTLNYKLTKKGKAKEAPREKTKAKKGEGVIDDDNSWGRGLGGYK